MTNLMSLSDAKRAASDDAEKAFLERGLREVSGTVAELARTIEIGELGAVSPAEYEALLSEIEAMPDDEVRAYLEAEEKRERN